MDIYENIKNDVYRGDYERGRAFSEDAKIYQDEAETIRRKFRGDLLTHLGWTRFPRAFAEKLLDHACKDGSARGLAFIVECGEGLDKLLDGWYVEADDDMRAFRD